MQFQVSILVQQTRSSQTNKNAHVSLSLPFLYPFFRETDARKMIHASFHNFAAEFRNREKEGSPFFSLENARRLKMACLKDANQSSARDKLRETGKP